MPSFDATAFFEQFIYDPKNPLLFNNGFFVFFFAIFIALYYHFRNDFRTRRYIFCFFSLYFFYKASGSFVLLVILSAVVDYFLSNAIYAAKSRRKKTTLLIASIVFNLGMLVYFKYTNFFIETFNGIFETGFNPLNILLPVGISFYTFENISYTIDVYRNHFIPVKKFSDYLLFLSFFPKLVMGPIVRAADFIPQINKQYNLSETDFAKGFYLIISGLIKKEIISDYISVNFVNYIFDDPSRYTGIENLFAVYGYAIVIYCDFSGYSDIAIGIARWLGFHIPTNFLSPYQSASITEFWRRWHRSLSSWLRDYLYIPLGGNRKASIATYIFSAVFFGSTLLVFSKLLGYDLLTSLFFSLALFIIFIFPSVLAKDRKNIPTNLNLMTTMLLGGFWHGASWNFIIWGSLHGIGLAIHKIWMLLTNTKLAVINNRLWYRLIAGFITFHFVCFCWIFFKAENFNIATQMISQITGNLDFSFWPPFFENYKPVLGMILFAGMLHFIPDSYADRIIAKLPKVPLIAYMSVFFAFLLLYSFFKSASVMPIYLQF